MMVAAAMLGAGLAASVANAAEGLSDGDKVCLGCHGTEGLTSKLADGDTLSLVVDGAAFARSIHQPIGCVGCHAQIKVPDHPGNVKPAASARHYAQAQAEACRACHGRVFKTYEASAHAIRLREGNTAAPVCGDCHRPHQVAPASVQDGAERGLPRVPRRYRPCSTSNGCPMRRAISGPWPARPATRPTPCARWTCGSISARCY